MATIVNTPASSDNSNNGLGMILAVIVVLAVVFLFFVYGLPMLRQSMIPSTPQINVPGRIDVNLHQGAGQSGGTSGQK